MPPSRFSERCLRRRRRLRVLIHLHNSAKIIAAKIVPNHDDLQLYFSVRAGTFWSAEIDEMVTADGVYYQYFGTAEILVGDARKILHAGDGIFMPAGTRFRLKPIGIPLQARQVHEMFWT
jgi:hypothetical protein